MASLKRITVQIAFNGPSPIVTKTNGTYDKRLTLINLGRLLRGVDHGSQYRPTKQSRVVVQDTTVQASATVTPAAVVAGDTLTIGGTALTATVQRANATLTAATAIAGTTFVLNGVTFTGVTGAAVPGTATFSVDTSNTACAASIAAQINAYGGSTIAGLFRAKSAAAVVTIFASTVGTYLNGTPLVGTATVLVASAATLTGGLAVTNNTFDPTGTNLDTGNAIANAIKTSTSAAMKAIFAPSVVSSTGVVTVESKAPGVAGNAVTFVSSNGGRLAVTGSGFLAGGSAGAPFDWGF